MFSSTAPGCGCQTRWVEDPEPAAGIHSVVLVEGTSDRLALEALARRRGRDLSQDGIGVVAMGGATNIGHFLQRYGPAGHGLRVAGLCDVAEVGYFQRALEHAGLIADQTRRSLHAAGFYVCEADLEDELIRALGIEAMERFIDSQGELGGFRTFQKQPAQQGRSIERQLRRFVGVRGGRKNRYAPALIDELDLDRIPRPLDLLLEHV